MIVRKFINVWAPVIAARELVIGHGDTNCGIHLGAVSPRIIRLTVDKCNYRLLKRVTATTVREPGDVDDSRAPMLLMSRINASKGFPAVESTFFGLQTSRLQTIHVGGL